MGGGGDRDPVVHVVTSVQAGTENSSRCLQALVFSSHSSCRPSHYRGRLSVFALIGAMWINNDNNNNVLFSVPFLLRSTRPIT